MPISCATPPSTCIPVASAIANSSTCTNSARTSADIA